MDQLQTRNIVLQLHKKYLSPGYSLIEVLIAVGILGIVMVGLTGILVQSTSSMGKVNALADAASQVNLLKASLEDPATCRLNFGGKIPPIANTTIRYKLTDTTLGDPVIPFSTTPPTTLKSNQAAAVSNLIAPGLVLGSSGNQILRLKSDFVTKAEESYQAKSVLDFPLFAKIDSTTGAIQECSSRSLYYDGNDLNEKICDLASTSTNELIYDPTTGTCTAALEMRCTTGGPTSATCAPGAVSFVDPLWKTCQVQNFSGENLTYTRDFNGIPKKLPMTPFICETNTSNFSMNCLLADDLDKSKGTVCLACCMYKTTQK